MKPNKPLMMSHPLITIVTPVYNRKREQNAWRNVIHTTRPDKTVKFIAYSRGGKNSIQQDLRTKF